MTIWKQKDSWCFEYFDRDSPASLFPGFEDFLDLWHAKQGDLSDDFEFYEMLASEMLFAGASGTLFWQGRQNVHVVVLELPLSDGERATHGLSLMHRVFVTD